MPAGGSGPGSACAGPNRLQHVSGTNMASGLAPNEVSHALAGLSANTGGPPDGRFPSARASYIRFPPDMGANPSFHYHFRYLLSSVKLSAFTLIITRPITAEISRTKSRYRT